MKKQSTIDFKNFKVISRDKKCTTMKHKDGHELKIAHDALSPKMRSQLAELHMSQGGEVPGYDEGGEVYKPYVDPYATKSPTPQGGSNDPDKKWSTGDKKQFEKAFNGHYDGAMQGVDGPIKPDDTVAAKREAYNKIASMGFPEAALSPDEKAKLFSEQKPEPDQFNADVWKSAEIQHQMDKEKQAAAMQQMAAQQQAQNQARMAAGLPAAAGPAPASIAPATNQAPVSPQQGGIMAGASPQSPQQPGGDPYGTQAYGEAYSRGINEQKQGMFGEAQALGAQGRQEAAALQKAADNSAITLKAHQDNIKALTDERNNFIHDYQNQHIDPDHYWANKSTVGKIAAIIGMTLGGGAAGYLHQDNLAAKTIQSAIDRDLDAQKAEMGKKQNLLSYNMQQFKNVHDATEMTRVMQNDIVSNQLKQAAAKAMDPVAKARALQAAGKLDMDSAATQAQIAMRKTLLGGVSAGRVDPNTAVRMIIPEHQQAAAYKELGEAQEAVKARDNVLAAFDKIAQINTVGNRLSSPLQSKRQIDAIKGPIVAALSKATAGRFTEQDAGMLDALFSGMGEDAQTQAVKRAQTLKLITEKMNYPVLKSYGIDPVNNGRFNQMGGSRIQESAPVKRK